MLIRKNVDYVPHLVASFQRTRNSAQLKEFMQHMKAVTPDLAPFLTKAGVLAFRNGVTKSSMATCLRKYVDALYAFIPTHFPLSADVNAFRQFVIDRSNKLRDNILNLEHFILIYEGVKFVDNQFMQDQQINEPQDRQIITKF